MTGTAEALTEMLATMCLRPKEKEEFWKLEKSIKRGRYVDKLGYVVIHVPGHCEATTNGWAREHRVIMSEFLGRQLAQREHIHHKNGVKDDNRIENLEVLDWSSHGKFHNKPTRSVEQRIKISKSVKRSWDKRGRRVGCCVDGCDQTHRARGFCLVHYRKFLRGTL